MSDSISLTTRQIAFITEMLEIQNAERAVEKYMEIMIEERMEPSRIDFVVTRTMKAWENRK